MYLKPKVKTIFINFCMIFVIIAAKAQEIPSKYSSSKDSTFFYPRNIIAFNLPKGRFLPVPGNFYSKNIGFFCRQEIRLDNAIKIPFRFRLGSVNDCDWLEGKRNSFRYR